MFPSSDILSGSLKGHPMPYLEKTLIQCSFQSMNNALNWINFRNMLSDSVVVALNSQLRFLGECPGIQGPTQKEGKNLLDLSGRLFHSIATLEKVNVDPTKEVHFEAETRERSLRQLHAAGCS